MSQSARAALILLVFVGGLIAILVTRNVREERTWQEILELASQGPVAPEQCMDPPASTGLPAGFCFLDRDPKLNQTVDGLVIEASGAEVRAWFQHVVEHGWSGPVSQVVGALLRNPEASWSRAVAARLLNDEDAVLRVYARECRAREAAGGPTKSTLVHSYRSILDLLAYSGGRYGTKSKAFELDGLLAIQCKVGIPAAGD